MQDPRWMPFLRIILVNGATLYGIFVLHWGIFALVYAFWWDLLIESLFIWLKMKLASAPFEFDESEISIKINGKQVNSSEFNQNGSTLTGFYFQSRLFMLFIYWVFIQIIGFGSVVIDKNLFWYEDWFSITIFRDKAFYVAVLFVFSAYLQDYISYHKKEVYKKTSKKDLFVVFDSKTIFIHVYIIGAMGLYFLIDRNFPTYKHLTVPISGGIFVLVKCLISLQKLKNQVLINEKSDYPPF